MSKMASMMNVYRESEINATKIEAIYIAEQHFKYKFGLLQIVKFGALLTTADFDCYKMMILSTGPMNKIWSS